MAKKLDYEPKKWEKERKERESVKKQFKKQSKGQDFDSVKLKGKLGYYINVEASQRNYRRLYENLYLHYKILAGDRNLIDKDEKACLECVYLSGISGILSKLFDTPEERDGRDLTDAKNFVWDFDYALLQLFAVNQPLPSCIHEVNHVYIKLFQGEFDKVEVLLSQLGSKMDEKEPYKPYISDLDRRCIQAIIQRDSNVLQEELIKHINGHRKWPAGLGYSVFVDIFSIVFIKLAQKYDISCDINVIEIPHLFLIQRHVK